MRGREDVTRGLRGPWSNTEHAQRARLKRLKMKHVGKIQ